MAHFPVEKRLPVRLSTTSRAAQEASLQGAELALGGPHLLSQSPTPPWVSCPGRLPLAHRSPACPTLSFQFLIYFMYFLVLFVAYFSGAMLVILQHLRQGPRQPLPVAQELRCPAEETVQVLSVKDGAYDSLEPDAPSPAPEYGVQATGWAPQEQSPQPKAKS